MVPLLGPHHAAFSTLKRRARLVAGLAPWASARPQYRLKLGGALLPFSALSDEALADLRSRIADDVRRERALRLRAAA